MKIVNLTLNQKSYAIQIGTGLLADLGLRLFDLGFKRRAVIITNPVVRALFGTEINFSLGKYGIMPSILEIPEGEKQKSLNWAGRLYEQLNVLQVERLTPVLALGGGVIGDLAGFVSATYMRGLPLIQIPTTLLAQVDSSIGGKVAINYGELKNNIGTFYHPFLVISDISTLKTLPLREKQNGIAEIIKYGIIKDKTLFRLLESNISKLISGEETLLEEVIFRCATIKAEIVEKDERDFGLRNILNFGHTLGHAIETASRFCIPHGKAVAFGMLAASHISLRMSILPPAELEQIRSLLTRAGFRSKFPSSNIEGILDVINHDKKKKDDKLRFILPETIGEVLITDKVNIGLIREVLKELT
jgi:3-dehydroquinate synthase